MTFLQVKGKLIQCCYSEKQILILTRLDGKKVKKKKALLCFAALCEKCSDSYLCCTPNIRLGYLIETSFYSV